LVAALAAAAFLAKNSQETRRGASYASVEALFLPSVKTVSVGDKLVTTLMIDAKSHFLTGADIKVKFDATKLQMEGADILAWSQETGEVLISENDNERGTYSLVGTNILGDVAKLPTGVISIVKLNFVAVASGEVKVDLDGNYANIITGYNVGGADQELGIERVSWAVYTISGGTDVPTLYPVTTRCDWCGTNCVDFNKMDKNIACPMIYVEGKTCVDDGGFCVIKPSVGIDKFPAVE